MKLNNILAPFALAAAFAVASFGAPTLTFACGGHDEHGAEESPADGSAKAAAPEQAKPAEEEKKDEKKAPATPEKPAEEAPANPDKT